jgi:hypothetical protein
MLELIAFVLGAKWLFGKKKTPRRGRGNFTAALSSAVSTMAQMAQRERIARETREYYQLRDAIRQQERLELEEVRHKYLLERKQAELERENARDVSTDVVYQAMRTLGWSHYDAMDIAKNTPDLPSLTADERVEYAIRTMGRTTP